MKIKLIIISLFKQLKFDFEPLYLNISINASSWGIIAQNDSSRRMNYKVYSRGIFYASDSFSMQWSIGVFYDRDGYRNYGKLNGKTYSWYSESGGAAQFNETNLTYYWFCLER